MCRLTSELIQPRPCCCLLYLLCFGYFVASSSSGAKTRKTKASSSSIWARLLKEDAIALCDRQMLSLLCCFVFCRVVVVWCGNSPIQFIYPPFPFKKLLQVSRSSFSFKNEKKNAPAQYSIYWRRIRSDVVLHRISRWIYILQRLLCIVYTISSI